MNLKKKNSSLIAEEYRIRKVYSNRDNSKKPKLYAWYRREVLFSEYRFRVLAANTLTKYGLFNLPKMNVLDVGCGNGKWLRTLMEWGATANNLHGIDLLPDRVEKALQVSPNIDFKVGNGWKITFQNSTMDLVTANTVFSSILNSTAREALANEMKRVLKSNGLILIYDFRISHPGNSETIGIRKSEIRRLFKNFDIFTQSLILAPPLSRKISPIFPLLSIILECLIPFLRTHYIFALKPTNK